MPEKNITIQIDITSQINEYIEKFMNVSGMSKSRVIGLLIAVSIFWIKPDDMAFNKYTRGPYLMDQRKVEE